MQLAEEEALARGCHDVSLDTDDFQARSFYERPGYVQSANSLVFRWATLKPFLKKALGT
ncbi:GNAT family N-acetyltransferase [Paraburkholderia sprentiae]|uniref:GNAT family N-acetyltransferase n=1 Tax=Paraburkholderia sprentiae TaxID=948107 RepID=UPI00389AD876